LKYKINILRYMLITGLLTVAACSDNTSRVVDGTQTSVSPEAFSPTDPAGSSAADLLRSDTFTRIFIEVDWVEGFKPSDSGLDSLKVFMEQRLHKPDGIKIMFDEAIESPGISKYSSKDIRNLEEEHRSNHTNGNTLVIYVLALDAESENENVLGLAYFNTSIAIFQQLIQQSTNQTFRPNRVIVEGAVLRHEMGHLMGLVNNGTPMVGEEGGPDDHHDEDNGAHCTVEGSLMHFRIRTSNFGNAMMESYIPRLEPLDIVDLRANGGK